MLKTMADNNLNISANTDSALYHALGFSQKSYILKGYGEDLGHTLTGLTFSLKKGLGVIYGRHILNDGTEPVNVSIPPNTRGFICLRYDKGNPVGAETSLVTTSTISQEDVLNNGAKFDLQLAEYSSTASVVTIIKDLRIYSVELVDILTKLNYLISMDVGGTINSNTKQNLTKKYGKNSLTYEAVLDHVNEFFKRRNTMKTVNVPGAPTISFTNVLSWAELENMKLYEVQVVLRIGESFISYADAIVVRFNETIRLYKSVTGDAGKMQLQISASYNLQLEVSHPINSIATIYYRLLDNQ